MQEPIIGIDLGTTNSVVSILEDKLPKTLLIDGDKLLPSVVSLSPEGFSVGKIARNMAILEPENTIASIKRKMGQNINVPIGDQQMRPEEISALILQKIRQAAIDHFQLSADAKVRAVITVPAYFTEEQREATKQAGELANLQVERIINEPTAAALAFGMSNLDEATYAIYDFGGGTFDVSVIESDAGLVEVKASTGNNHLGGDDLDELLSEQIWNTFLKVNELSNIEPSNKEQARLKRIAEQTKIKLSERDSVDIQESFFLKKDGVNYHLEQSITRKDFENLIREKVEETINHLNKAVAEADLTKSDLDGIILVGGSSRIPLISQLIEEKLGIIPALIDLPDEAVSHGATIQGAIIDNLDVDTVLVDITPHSLGIGVLDDETFSLENYRELERRKEMGEDKPKLDLGAAVIIPKNAPIPIKRSNFFYSSTEFQEKYRIEVFQGENNRLNNNKSIGEVYLTVANPIEEGKIEVTFELDINGLLKLKAVETTTKEIVNAKFKSSKGKKIRKSKLEKLQVVATDKAENALIKRAEALLAKGGMEPEDSEELQELVESYKEKQAEGNTHGLSKLEDEILDLLYYLEKEEA